MDKDSFISFPSTLQTKTLFQGVLIALDKTKPKVAKIMNNISVLKSTCVHAFHYDATKCCDPLAPPRIADLGKGQC